MKTVHFTETVDAKTKLDVLVEIGSLIMRPSIDGDVHIEATYRHMDIWIERHDNTVVVRAEQEEDMAQKLGRPFRDGHPKVDLTIDVPTHCPIQAKVISGSLALSEMMAPVSARVITGQLHLREIQAPIYAKTVTGQLAYTGSLTEDNHRFEVTSGEMVLTVPEGTNGQLYAQTITGSVSCQLPLTERHEERRLIGRKLRGTLGSGTGRIKAKVTTGNLEIRPLQPGQNEPEELIHKAEMAG